MPSPSVDDVYLYLSDAGITSWSDEQVDAAYQAEKAAQAKICNVPADDAVWPAHLVEALYRRVASNLARRKLPLGIASGELESIRVAGRDSEVARLESGCRRWVVA